MGGRSLGTRRAEFFGFASAKTQQLKVLKANYVSKLTAEDMLGSSEARPRSGRLTRR
jgi:hypothetical protein